MAKNKTKAAKEAVKVIPLADKGTKNTNPSKKEKNTEKLKDANLADAGKEAAKKKESKELMYQYPADIKSGSQKKDFRRKARARLKSFDKTIAKLTTSTEPGDKKELEKVTKEMDAWKKETYNKSYSKN
jgi:hypothetical protein